MFSYFFHCSEKQDDNSKYRKKDKTDRKSKSSSHKESETPSKCWLYPQTRVRIISKDFKKGKYYNKKVTLFIINPMIFGLLNSVIGSKKSFSMLKPVTGNTLCFQPIRNTQINGYLGFKARFPRLAHWLRLISCVSE